MKDTPMDDEVAKAAAECVKSLRWLATGNFDIEDARREMLAAANIIEAEHPADSDLPLTEEWLRSVGFEAKDVGLKLGILLRWEVDGAWSIVAGSHFAHIPKQPKTRGDLRQLARDLGIELKGE